MTTLGPELPPDFPSNLPPRGWKGGTRIGGRRHFGKEILPGIPSNGISLGGSLSLLTKLGLGTRAEGIGKVQGMGGF